jgi:hypothetical protein
MFLTNPMEFGSAVATSVIAVIALRSGGKKPMLVSMAFVFLALSGYILWRRAQGLDELPLWIDLLIELAFVSAVAGAVLLASSNRWRPLIQIGVGSLAGVAAYPVAALGAYMLWSLSHAIG